MRALFSLLLFAGLLSAEDLPIVGISHVNFAVTDLEKARLFYGGLLGYQPAFQFDKADGSGPSLLFYKVNDNQFIEVSPGLKPDQDRRMSHVAFQTSDIEKLHKMLTDRGLNPSPIGQGKDGNKACRIKDPEGNILEFTQYLPAGMHAQARGKALSDRAISNHLLHAGIVIVDREGALKFYRDKMGFQEFWRGGRTDGDIRWINMRTPGSNGDYIELMLTEANPNRQALGSMQHICLEVPDIQKAYATAKQRAPEGMTIAEPKIGRNKKWQLNLFDPDGSRTELMEPRTVN
jgi:catechol 2,3-dioxygenase-like lactoylglutathione lyase family enzyme